MSNFPRTLVTLERRNDQCPAGISRLKTHPKVISAHVDTQSSAEHLIGVKTMSGAFRVIWVSWAVVKHSKK